MQNSFPPDGGQAILDLVLRTPTIGWVPGFFALAMLRSVPQAGSQFRIAEELLGTRLNTKHQRRGAKIGTFLVSGQWSVITATKRTAHSEKLDFEFTLCSMPYGNS